ncbi:unnamed protein product [Tuber aestivum]|uniref:Uncharacterized protein n=1 Tax=Tuber aestivum TaxID=59557 RepID=A0A292PPN1_9PEZI|nr:unnamed protein product [Tuber aestivum]
MTRISTTMIPCTETSLRQRCGRRCTGADNRVPARSRIGVELWKKDGNPVDAAIGNLYCLSAFYRSVSVKARAEFVRYCTADLLEAQVGGLAIVITGEFPGYTTAYAQSGRIRCQDIWQPSVDLDTSELSPVGGLRKSLREECTGTLEVVAGKGEHIHDRVYSGVQQFHNGSIAKQIIEAVNKHGGILTTEDFLRYLMTVEDMLKTSFDGREVITCPSPCRYVQQV